MGVATTLLAAGFACLLALWVTCLRSEVRRLRDRELSAWRAMLALRREVDRAEREAGLSPAGPDRRDDEPGPGYGPRPNRG